MGSVAAVKTYIDSKVKSVSAVQQNVYIEGCVCCIVRYVHLKVWLLYKRMNTIGSVADVH